MTTTVLTKPSPHDIGDATERKVAEALRARGYHVEMAGHLCTFYDLIVTCGESRRGVQVKTLTEGIYTSVHFMMNDQYPDDLLIVAVNTDWTRFFTAPAGICKGTLSVTVSLPNPKRKTDQRNARYERCQFTNSTDWMNAVVPLLATSTLVTEVNTASHMSSRTRLEHESVQRLVTQLSLQGLSFRPNDVLASSIDGWIGPHAVQLKSTSRRGPSKNPLSWNTHMQTYSHRANNKEVYKPYHATAGFDYVLVEGRPDHWFIIPTQVLIDNKVLTTDTQPGRTFMTVSVGEVKETKYQKYYRNWDQLKVSHGQC